MEEEGLFSHKDEILFLLGLLSLVMFAGMVGNIIPIFIITFLVVLAVSSVHALIKIEAFNKDFLRKTIEDMYIILFSLFITTVFAVILPYLILPESFLNIFVLQYIYLFPLLFIFFICLYLFEYLFEGKTIRHHHMIGLSLVLTITISLIISVLLIAAINRQYDITINNIDARTQDMISQFKEGTSESYPALLIFNEIKSHRDKIIDDQQKERKSFAEIEGSRGLCIQTDCVKIIFERTFLSETQTMDMQITEGMLKNAYAEHEFINKKEYLNEFRSLEEYRDYLKDKLDWHLPPEEDQEKKNHQYD